MEVWRGIDELLQGFTVFAFATPPHKHADTSKRSNYELPKLYDETCLATMATADVWKIQNPYKAGASQKRIEQQRTYEEPRILR